MSPKKPPEDEKVIQVRPVDPESSLLREKYIENFVGQSERMDKLGFQLITLELAIPSLLLGVLKLVHGKEVAAPYQGLLGFSFILWTLALGFTMWAIFPMRYKVDTAIVDKDSTDLTNKKDSPPLGIREFFRVSATNKRNRLFAAVLFFWAGLLLSLFGLFRV